MSPAGVGGEARCATAGQFHHATAARAAATARSVHRFIILSGIDWMDMEQNVITFCKPFVALRSKIDS